MRVRSEELKNAFEFDDGSRCMECGRLRQRLCFDGIESVVVSPPLPVFVTSYELEKGRRYRRVWRGIGNVRSRRGERGFEELRMVCSKRERSRSRRRAIANNQDMKADHARGYEKRIEVAVMGLTVD